MQRGCLECCCWNEEESRLSAGSEHSSSQWLQPAGSLTTEQGFADAVLSRHSMKMLQKKQKVREDKG